MIDWTKAEVEFVAGDLSLKATAEKLEVSYSTLSKVAAEGKWTAKRKEYRKSVAKKSLTRARARDEKKLDRLLLSAENVLSTAILALEDDKQFNRYLIEHKEKYDEPVEGEDGEQIVEKQWVEEKVFHKVDSKAMKEMTAVIKDLTGLLRDFYDIPTPGQKAAQEIARERLALERLRSGSGNDDGKETGVIILPPVKEKQDDG